MIIGIVSLNTATVLSKDRARQDPQTHLIMVHTFGEVKTSFSCRDQEAFKHHQLSFELKMLLVKTSGKAHGKKAGAGLPEAVTSAGQEKIMLTIPAFLLK